MGRERSGLADHAFAIHWPRGQKCPRPLFPQCPCGLVFFGSHSRRRRSGKTLNLRFGYRVNGGDHRESKKVCGDSLLRIGTDEFDLAGNVGCGEMQRVIGADEHQRRLRQATLQHPTKLMLQKCGCIPVTHSAAFLPQFIHQLLQRDPLVACGSSSSQLCQLGQPTLASLSGRGLRFWRGT